MRNVKRRALFLDRDGIINVDHGYVGRVEDFVFVDGVFELVRAARARGLLPVVVTNQSGIARGYFDENQFHFLTDHMNRRFAEEAAPLERVYFCPYHPQASIARYRREDPDRKPGPGMFLRAAAELNIDLPRSAMIGDQWTDAVAASSAGVRQIALVGEPDKVEPPQSPPVVRLATVRDAVAWVLGLTD